MIGTKLPALPATARTLEQKHYDQRTDYFGYQIAAQDHFKYDLDGDGLCDVFEILSPTKHVRVVIDRANRTREDFVASNLSQFGQPDVVRYHSKDSFSGGYQHEYEFRDPKTGAVAGGTESIQGNVLRHVYPDGKTYDEKLELMSGQQFAERKERVALSPNVGFSVFD